MSNSFGKFCSSIDGEDYSGKCETLAEAHAEAQARIDEETMDGVARDYWVAQSKHPLDCIGHNYIGSDCVERICELMGDEVGGDDAAIDMSNDDESALGKLILDFIREKSVVQRYGIENPIKFTHVSGVHAK